MASIENDQSIHKLYNTIIHTKPLSSEYAVVFVYNEESRIEDTEHSSECITSIERDMIINSFCKLCLNGMPVPLLRNCYSIFNGTKYR